MGPRTIQSPRVGVRRALTILAVGLAMQAHARTQTSQTWVAPYAQPTADSLAGVVVDALGRSFVAGTTSLPPQSSAGFVRAYDAQGVVQWTRTFAVPGKACGWSDVAIGPSGMVAVAGAIRDPLVPASADVVVSVFANDGRTLWRATWDGAQSLDDESSVVAFDPAGRVVVAGSSTKTAGNDTRDGFVAVYGTTGQLAWARTTGIAVTERITDVAIDAAGAIFAIGEGGTPGAFVTRFENDGTVGWSVQRNFEYPIAVAVDASNGVYVVGSGGGPPGQGGFYVAGLEALTGAQRFLSIPTVGLFASAADVVVTPFGEIVATGYASTPIPSFAAFTFACDASGNESWRDQLGFDLNSNSFGLALCAGPGGDVTVAGSITGPNEGPWIARYARGAAPVRSWTNTTPPLPGLTYPTAISVAGHGADGVTIASSNGGASLSDVVTWHLEPLAQATCFGDGSGTACPCGNASHPLERAGCASSGGAGGRLVTSGTASLASDDLRLHGAFLINGPVMFFQGTSDVASGMGGVFGDGLRCAGGVIVRLAARVTQQGAVSYPNSGAPAVSIAGAVPTSGSARVYQLLQRDVAPTFCTSATFNTTNAVAVVWRP